VDLLSHGRRQTRLWHLIASLALAQTTTVALWPQSSGEYDVKAAFLYKFASFVDWPEPARNEAVGICIVGRDPFGSALERVVEGKTIGGRAFVVRRLKDWKAGAPCHILFIGGSDPQRLRAVLGQVRHEPILTVGDIPGFCESGGGINLMVVDSKVKLEINVDATARSGLQVSSKLLSLARIVHDTASAAARVTN
jgi:YfiR/HmsC-like